MRLLNYPLTGANRARAPLTLGDGRGADFADIIDHFSGAWGAGAVFQCQRTKMFWGREAVVAFCATLGCTA